MNRNLVYYSVGINVEYSDILKLSIDSIRQSNGYGLDILVITDREFYEENLRTMNGILFHFVEKTSDPNQICFNRLRIFEYEFINKYERLLFLDADIIVNYDLNNLFDNIVPNKLNVVVEDYNIKNHDRVHFSLSTYTKEDLNFFEKNKIYTFNSGTFMFENTVLMKRHFSNVNNLIKNYRGEFFADQSFTNYYFNSYALTNTDAIRKDENYIYNWVHEDINDNDDLKDKIIHFIGSTYNGKSKLEKIKIIHDKIFKKMIVINGVSEDKTVTYYSSTVDYTLEVNLRIYDIYTDGLIYSENLNLEKGINYYTYHPAAWKNRKLLFFNRKNNQLIGSFYLDGDYNIESYDVDNYLKKLFMYEKNDSRIGGILDVLREHFFVRQYSDKYDVEEGDTVVDIGFNYGIFSLGALKKNPSKIYGFEPNKNIFNKVEKIYPKNDIVKIFNLAVSNKNEMTTFFEGENTLASSITDSVVDFVDKYDVECVDFSDFIKKNGISKIDFLKVDCEGAEYNIFENINDDFFSTIKKIHVEFHFNDGNKVLPLINKLERCGFEWEYEKGKDQYSELGLIFAKKKVKRIVGISSYCDSEEKLKILEKNIDLLKNNNLDVAVISPLLVPEYLIKKLDYFFFTKENPTLDWPTHSMQFWKDFHINNGGVRLTTTIIDYGYAGLYHVKKLGQILMTHDYDYFGFIIYDTILEEPHLSMLKEGRPSIIYPSKRNEKIWKVGLHLMCFNREYMSKVIDKITLQNYLKYPDSDAFTILHDEIVQPLGIEIGKEPVSDEIFIYENFDYFNCSEDEVKYFISSPDEYYDTIKLYFYDLKDDLKLKLIVNETQSLLIVKSGDIVDLDTSKHNLQNAVIEYNNKSFDITKKIKEIKNNTIKLIWE